MLDAIPVMTVVAAAIVGWVLCFMNKRVFFLWKLVAPFVILPLAVWLISQLFGVGSMMALWSGIKIDWLTLGLALAPVLIWPIRADKVATQRAVARAG